jgi:hypothetical protein
MERFSFPEGRPNTRKEDTQEVTFVKSSIRQGDKLQLEFGDLVYNNMEFLGKLYK